MDELEELKGIEPEAGAAAPVEPIEPAKETVQETPATEQAPEPSAIAGLRRDFQAKLAVAEQRAKDAEERLTTREREQPQQQRQEPQGEAPKLSPEEIAYNSTLNAHEAAARAQYGPQNVTAAQNWFKQANDQALAFEVRNSQFPYETLMERFSEAIEINRLQKLYAAGFDSRDPDAWVKKRAAELAELERGEVAATQQPATKAPSRSIASTPSSGGSAGSTPTGSGTAFDAEFG